MIWPQGKEFLARTMDEAFNWCQGKSWLVRLPPVIWLVYIFFRHFSNPDYTGILSSLNLAIHELGHLVFSFFGQFICVAGGTIAQLLAPLIALFNFYKLKDFFAMSLSFGWLSTSLFDAARYMADARSMELPLVSLYPSEEVLHDWNYLLGKMGLLNFDTVLAGMVRFTAVIVMLFCFVSSAWLLWRMFKSKSAREDQI
jgi:hypothetical protein